MSMQWRGLFNMDAEPITDAELAVIGEAIMPHLLDEHSPEFDARALLITKLILRINQEKRRAIMSPPTS